MDLCNHIFISLADFLRISPLDFSNICMMLGGDKSQKLIKPNFSEIQVSQILSEGFENGARMEV